MSIYKNTTSDQPVVLIPRYSKDNGGTDIYKINISNNSADNAVVDVYISADASNPPYFYIIKDVVIPSGVALVLDDCVNYSSRGYNLIIHNTGTNPDLTIMIT